VNKWTPESFPPDDAVSRDFGGGGNRTRVMAPPENGSKQGFSASVQVGVFTLAVQDDQLFIYEPGCTGDSEPLESVIWKLRSLLACALLSIDHVDPMTA
jgi:hypothetical protein